nr:unnamed protein product [Leishmania braziliensis]
MDADTLLRLTVLSFGASVAQVPHIKHQKDITGPSSPHIATPQDIRITFINLWAEQLGQLTSIKGFLRDTLLFFLPGRWCSDPCETQNLELNTNVVIGTEPFALCLEQYRTRTAVKSWAANPFFQHLDVLVTQLQPKLPHAQLSFQEWLKAMDHVLGGLRTLFATLYSAFFNSFCEVCNMLVDSYRRLVWRDVQSSYALAVCNLSRTIESKLITVVANTISTSIDSCKANTTLQLFSTPRSLTADEVAGYLTSTLQTRLGDVASSAAVNTSFLKHYPQAAASLVLAQDSREKLLTLFYSSITAYVEKLLAVEGEPDQRVPSVTEPFTFQTVEKVTSCRANHATTAPPVAVEESTVAQAAQVSSYAVRSVSVEDTLMLTTISEGVDVFSRVAALITHMGDVEKSVQDLVAKQREEEQAVLGGAPGKDTQRGSLYGADETTETATPTIGGASVRPKRLSVVLAEPVECYRSNPKETLLFWKRLQRRLGLDEGSLTQVMAHCVFQYESPYPNVYLKDLDVRNNDRASRLFVEEVRSLLLLEEFTTIKARNLRLVSEACSSYGKLLWEKTLEIQATLPCLPLRVSGVLLGTLYAAMRADKQFESLKQIRMQLCHVATKTGGNTKDAAILVNSEILLLKRAEFLADAVNDAEYEVGREKCTQLIASEAATGIQPESRAEVALPNIVGETILSNKGFCSSISPCARASGSSVLPKMEPTSFIDVTWRGSSIMDVLAQSRKSVSELPAKSFSLGTSVADVYRQACRCHDVNPNSSLVQELSCNDADSFVTLDLSNIYVGVKGLRPVLDLLQYNGEHLVSLSLCNNNLESDDVSDLCSTLRGPAGRNLVHLDLSYNLFTNAAVPFLKELVLSLTCIETLAIKDTLLSPHAARKLQEILDKKAIQRCV